MRLDFLMVGLFCFLRTISNKELDNKVSNMPSGILSLLIKPASICILGGTTIANTNTCIRAAHDRLSQSAWDPY